MYTAYRRRRPDKGDEYYLDLIPATRAALWRLGKLHVIENVEGAPLGLSLVLCGSMFGLAVRRHRVFECPCLLLAPGPCRHGAWKETRWPGGRSLQRGGPRVPCRRTVEVGRWDLPLADQRTAMGIDWMSRAELSQAVPPAYTYYLGCQLRRIIEG